MFHLRRLALPGIGHLKSGGISLSRNYSYESKNSLVQRLLQAKETAGLTFDEIASHCKLTNGYAAQLFMNQAKLTPRTAKLLQEIVPITDADIEMMKQFPMRSFDPKIIQDPLIYRLTEAVHHYGESIKSITNEKLGDGIMSAIDMYLTVETVKGVSGEDRIVIKLNGKFLPHIEQLADMDTSNDGPEKKN